MDLYFYNTLTRQKEKFVPIDPGQVKMYTCGPTVYRDIHIGNLRTYIMADLVRRVLEYNGYSVKKIQNITDVGHMRRNEENQEAFDPVIKSALERGKSPLEITSSYTDQFLQDSRRLNIVDADLYPKASDHIPQIIQIVKDLLAKGIAYDTGENIYFNVGQFAAYGRLSGNTLEKSEKLLEAVRVASETDKSDSADFVLWKRVDQSYLMKWESPWGLGTPGWHIECTAMSIQYLGRHLDIHTGGEDNIFPHHEDEIAQSEAWTGEKFVNYWLHGGHLLTDGEKMARRRGNVYLVQDIVDRGLSPLAFRYLTLTAGYRSKMNFTWEALEGSQRALDRLCAIAASPPDLPASSPDTGPLIGCAEFEERFLKAVGDDLDLPKALSIVWELVKSDYPVRAKRASLLRFDRVLGLGLDKSSIPVYQIPSEVADLVKQREEARSEKNFDFSDTLRRKVEDLGFTIEDGPSGPKVHKKTL